MSEETRNFVKYFKETLTTLEEILCKCHPGKMW